MRDIVPILMGLFTFCIVLFLAFQLFTGRQGQNMLRSWRFDYSAWARDFIWAAKETRRRIEQSSIPDFSSPNGKPVQTALQSLLHYRGRLLMRRLASLIHQRVPNWVAGVA